MAASDGQVLCAAARWAPGGRPLGEVVRAGLPLPAVLKIVRGSYAGLGVPSLPHPTLQPTVMLVSAGRRRQIIAQAVKLRPGRGPVAVGPRLSIPETYAGWFELLSEEGRAGRCVESVAELSRRPCPCLVREPLRAILARQADVVGAADGVPLSAGLATANTASTTAVPVASASLGAGVVADGSRTLAVGETISPGEEVSLPGGSDHPRGRYLTCVTSRGDTVLLSLEQRGRFSPLAKEHNISGAHSARTLLAKRLPLTVRLLHGPPPGPLARTAHRARQRKGTPPATPHFTTELRLLAAYEEEQVFAYPLQKETAGLVAVPLSAPLKVLRSRNEDALCALPEFARLADKCGRLLAEAQDRIHVVDAKAAPAAAAVVAAEGKTWRGVPFLRRSASSDSANLSPRHHQYHQHLHQDENRVPAQHQLAASSPRLSAASPDEYDEIDQIYDYVRGFAPLPKSVSVAARSTSPPSTPPAPPSASSSPPATPSAAVPTATAPLALTSCSAPPSHTKPEPPPIETIPSKKVGGKVHALNGGHHHSHLLLRDPHPQKQAEKRSRHKEKEADKTGARLRLYLKQGQCAPMAVVTAGADGQGAAGRGAPGRPQGAPQGTPLAPLLNSVRYKSLSNIHGAMDLDAVAPPASPNVGVVVVASGAGAGVGTLDSSHSGGRTSGDSGPGNKLPEKRSRKLSRPRSLTNLVWEIRAAPPPTKLEPGVHQPPHRNKLSIAGHKRLGTLYL